MEKKSIKNFIYSILIFTLGVIMFNYFSLKLEENYKNQNLKSEITLEELNNIYNFKKYIEEKLNNEELLSFQESRCMIFKCSNYTDSSSLNLDKESLKNLDVYLKKSEFNISEDYVNLLNKIKEEEIKSNELKKNELRLLIRK